MRDRPCASRCSGWRNSLAIGSLMNARGMMELIVIKVGLDAGVITPAMFTILLVMAIVTTMMTTPMVMGLLDRKRITDALTNH